MYPFLSRGEYECKGPVQIYTLQVNAQIDNAHSTLEFAFIDLSGGNNQTSYYAHISWFVWFPEPIMSMLVLIQYWNLLLLIYKEKIAKLATMLIFPRLYGFQNLSC